MAMKYLKEETINEVINLANRCYSPDEDEQRLFNFSDEKEVKKAFKLRPEEEQLEKFIDGLSNDEKTELMALMWLGRGDGEWSSLIDQAGKELNDAALYIAEKAPSLAIYLNRGIEKARAINLL